MALQITLSDPVDAGLLVDALLEQADEEDSTRPGRAARYRDLANRIGDALEAVVPVPSGHPAATASGRR